MDRIRKKYENSMRGLNKLLELQDIKTVESDVFRDALIQRFEFTFEMIWKLLKAYMEDQGIQDINAPKAVLKEAYAQNLIDHEDVWISMLKDRNLTSHIYSEAVAVRISKDIIVSYIPLFEKLLNMLEAKI
ncbi:nucleotidyltransferase substrate binding protein, HI0074 family [Peptoclostridium litorale DSM 5388]|uniref:Nucleotidyltransferase substrate binding protein n=1 Tax=Peptoclostridium litorale DSM 5388 TaxID=1121324 RepID=A0A069RFG0_PEPLI|nr:nucleotidyltransferase substrate binding protein [Peptoclostridium litorale]KDR94935.1 nucleotidyltransferase substrate binding protein [Peptoclostridium litorale DSM 5388]SIO34100.1 nucleotidyltransferase substrate binding protein, HI0074 family [Peptoclostridium litorale DSM 5388]